MFPVLIALRNATRWFTDMIHYTISFSSDTDNPNAVIMWVDGLDRTSNVANYQLYTVPKNKTY